MSRNKLFRQSAERHHNHLCPRQVLGVRIGLYAGDLLGIELPRQDKRIFCFVETAGCLTDGIAVASGCWWGRRTMYLMDYGKVAATFVDTLTERAVRIAPAGGVRERALDYAPDAPDRWHAQLKAYQIMPTDELLRAQQVTLNLDLDALIGRTAPRVVCAACGEDIINERFVTCGGQRLCIPCTRGAYYEVRVMAGSDPGQIPQLANVS